ncbi:FBD-associated F-box protein At4g10400-like [Panicum virgatum]|uniref:FBD-associated F-box protein At4g10400-like n=1 Tax=Panicum virgatum TaxID=38727 RepID=UPI0019D59B19|nr:FBD-associated F-box protein At4g10400-like [Panicum virgatum]
MPPWKRGKNAPAASGRDGFDALPDGVLEHILGFLPAPEAVGTCVLARRWRHLWKSATGLRIRCTGDDSSDEEEVEWAGLMKRQGFVDHLMGLRGRAPLESFELVFCRFHYDEDMDCLNRWVEHAVKCQVRMLRIENIDQHHFGQLEDQPLVSPYLARLEIVGLALETNFNDLSSCPSLEHLEITDCNFFSAQKISSQSLKHLIVSNSILGSHKVAVHFCVPSLVSLHLEGHFSKAPVFRSMPSLEDAFVRVAHRHTENLALVFVPITFTFNMEMKHCPTFRKLKSLLLNDFWCVPPDFHALTWMLKHSPVLQKLTLQLSEGPQHKLGIKGRRNPSEISAAILGNLKIVEVKCEVVDERVFKILKFLATLGIRFSLEDVDISEENLEP